MTKQELQQLPYFTALSTADQEMVMQSGAKLESEDDLRTYIANIRRS